MAQLLRRDSAVGGCLSATSMIEESFVELSRLDRAELRIAVNLVRVKLFCSDNSLSDNS